MRVSSLLMILAGEIREVSRSLSDGASQILRGHHTFGGPFLQRPSRRLLTRAGVVFGAATRSIFDRKKFQKSELSELPIAS